MTKSPTVRLLLGLLITLAAVTGFSSYALEQLSGLRKLQTQTIDLNRHDSLLLLQVESDVNTIGLKLRDMTQMPQTSGIGEFRNEFARLRADLEGAIQKDARFAPATRRAEDQAALADSLNQFWRTSDQVFNRASTGHERAARALVSTQLSKEQSILANRVSALLERNNESEERADMKVASIYAGVERDIYAFWLATMVAIVVTSLYLIYSNRRIFEKLESLSRQRRVLAARMITVQEEVLRSVSRELHDEFGQILTAVGAMLGRAERKGVPADSPLRVELSEVRQITHNTLEKMRSLSQMLHPSVIDDYGLAEGIEWYAQVFQRQTGIETTTKVSGNAVRITGQPAIHCFRIVQEALNNAAKHSGTKRAEVEMTFSADKLTVEVRDFGCGIAPARRPGKSGLGLIAMRERAELLSGSLNVSSVPNEGTTVSVIMPLQQEDHAPEALEDENIGELVIREL
ncbi:MAG: sensor histidine kinase [Acidobacteriaceae bacterium]|nr:sensor histidine kinase [Acidobacteriaceae bacterium]MBV9296618.1 sensor histidine kinase [Acidobacteriaceae bacterium]MBV9765002.1 sensor histidine kinase [Acidobacteriaceae bacterium]